jgi:hypothetical protein
MSSSTTRTWLGKIKFSVFEKDKCREILVVLTTGVVDTGGKFAATDTPIKVNLGKDVTTGVVDNGGKFAATINDSNGQLAVGVIDTGGAP